MGARSWIGEDVEALAALAINGLLGNSKVPFLKEVHNEISHMRFVTRDRFYLDEITMEGKKRRSIDNIVKGTHDAAVIAVTA